MPRDLSSISANSIRTSKCLLSHHNFCPTMHRIIHGASRFSISIPCILFSLNNDALPFDPSLKANISTRLSFRCHLVFITFSAFLRVSLHAFSRDLIQGHMMLRTSLSTSWHAQTSKIFFFRNEGILYHFVKLLVCCFIHMCPL